MNEAGAMSYLTNHGWPNGLQHAFLKNVARIPMRYFICDNSGSMATGDGHRLVGEGPNRSVVPATRWAELGDFVRFHSGLSEQGMIASQFRFLNGAIPINVGTGTENEHGIGVLNAFLEDGPSGGTPLCAHISQVIVEVRAMEQQLRANHQKVAIIIATDGESSDGNIADAMRPLGGLPVWVVIRLCTDDERVVDYWNNIDKILELDLDILDDITGEAKEVCENNTWLTYGEPLHRLREFGVTIRELDLLDEGKLSPEQIVVVIRTILGGNASEYPNPAINWKEFISAVNSLLGMEPKIWDPLTKKPAQWIKTKQLASYFNKSSGCTIS